jgi:hypothetical protein
MSGAQFTVLLGQAWLLAGLCVGVSFLLIGLDRVDLSARGAYGFRPLLLPGLVLLWPLVIWRWLDAPRAVTQPSLKHRHKRVHAAIWIGLALMLPLILGTALMLRRHDVPASSSVRISPAPSEADQ